MKLFLILFNVFTFFVLEAYSCDLNNPYRHINPDGSQGGLVSRGTKVAPTAHIGKNAKVCDRAWVDSNARILDYATIKEDAWIRDYSVVKDRATIAGQAVVWGTRNSPVEVGEDSKIYGEAKIMTGTKVSGRAEIYGTAILEDSNISSQARVCEGYIIKYQEIHDDYFCLETEAESRINVSLSNVGVNKFNRRPRWLEFKANAFNFSHDSNVYIITINGTQIHPERIDARGDFLRIENLEAIVDGVNEITLSGRDEFGKKISEKQFNLFIGTNSKTITLNPAPSSFMKFSISYEYNGEIYSGDFKNSGGSIVLEGLPTDTVGVSVKISGIGAEGIVAESFSSLSSMPGELAVSPFPKFKNNVIDFSGGLSDWTISHPGNVVINGAEKNTYLSVSAHETERVILAKTVSLSGDKKALSVNFDLSSFLMSKSFEKSVQVILANKDEKEVFLYEFAPATFNKNKSASGIINLQVGKKNIGSTVSVFFRILPVSQTNGIAQDSINVYQGNILNKFISFKPRNLAVRNIGFNPMPRSLSGEVSCSNVTGYSLDKSNLEVVEENLRNFSAGSFFNMPLISSNRIFGTLDIIRGDDSVIRSIELVGLQNGIEKFVTPLSKCADESIGEDRATDVHISISKNLVKYLFEVPSIQLSTVDVGVGAEIVLKVKATFEDEFGNALSMYSSSGEALKVLRAINLNTAFNYSGNDRLKHKDPNFNLDGVDNYDSPTDNYNRTGGDKWIVPAYTDILASILNQFAPQPTFPKWQVNDMAKLNGGRFLGHTEHWSGLDADIQFKEYVSEGQEIIFDFKELGSDKVRWKKVLDTLDDFLSGIGHYYKNIRNIYVHRNYNSSSEEYLNKRFENRCFQGRYIRFNAPWGSGTLLRDVFGHQNHYHLSFLPLKDDGQPREINLSTAELEEIDLDDFYFSLNPEATKLTVEPRSRDDFDGKKVFWRFQDKVDFNDLDMTATYGMWPPASFTNNLSTEKINFNEDSSIRYIYLSIAKENGKAHYGSAGSYSPQDGTFPNGACVERMVAIDLGEKRAGKRWTYKKHGNIFFLEEK